jgi:hypothetical protein
MADPIDPLTWLLRRDPTYNQSDDGTGVTLLEILRRADDLGAAYIPALLSHSRENDTWSNTDEILDMVCQMCVGFNHYRKATGKSLAHNLRLISAAAALAADNCDTYTEEACE